MAVNIFWLKRAEVKFENIVEYIQAEWGDKAAAVFINKVYNFLDILAEFPEIGAIENPEKGIRGFVITKQTTVFYKLKGDTVIILTFFDNRQNPDNKNTDLTI